MPGHCSKGVQPVPKAVYCSGCRDEHNCPRRDSNLDPLAPQADALTTERKHLKVGGPEKQSAFIEAID